VFSSEMNYIRDMEGGILKRLVICTLFLVCASEFAQASESTPGLSTSGYDLIPKKNVFKLREPEQPKPVTPTNPPLPKVYLAGISTIMNQKLVFLHVPGISRPGGQAAEQSLMLSERQREGDIEVLEINEQAGRVKIKQAGEVVELSFENNGVKSNPPANLASQPQPTANPPPLPQGAQPGPQNPASPEMSNNPDAAMMPQNPTATGPLPPPLPTTPPPQNRLNKRLPSRGY